MTQTQEYIVDNPSSVKTFDFANQIYPYQYYQELQAKNPIVKVKNYGWIVTGYSEVLNILRDNRFGAFPPVETSLLSVLRDRNPLMQKLMRPPLRLIMKRNKFVKMTKNWLIFTNPPTHTRLRKISQAAFTSKVIKALYPRIKDVTTDLLNQIENEEEFDLIKSFSYPLPIIMITEILGIHHDDRDQFKEWSQAILSGFNQDNTDLSSTRKAMKAQDSAVEFLETVISAKENSTNEDMITQLINARKTEGKMTNEELISNLILLLIAGHETTVNLITNTTYSLLSNYDQFIMLKNNNNFLNNAIEESLRFDPPVSSLIRVARENIIFNNYKFRKGDAFELSLFAANRDPSQFPNPNRFEITRENSRQHLSFGQGIHYCLGAPLARAEAEVAFTELLTRFPSLRLAKGFKPQRKTSFGFSAFESLMVQKH